MNNTDHDRASPNKGVARRIHTIRAVVFSVVAALISSISVANAEDPAKAPMRITVKGKNLLDAQGKIVQLRGANVSGLEFVAIQGWSANDPWGNQYNDQTLKVLFGWKANVVRLPLNEASWLGYQCIDSAGAVKNPDPGHNYQKTVKQAVEQARNNGLYVILDLHMSAPDDPLRAVSGVKAVCPMLQNPMPSADHSIDFWSSIAQTFKDSPHVLFELFNEPYFDWKQSYKNDWEILRDGGTFRAYRGDTTFVDGHAWKAAGMQQLLDAVRKTGATNVILVGGPNWSQRIDEWLKYKPSDPLNQLVAAWHAYPGFNKKWGTDDYNLPGLGAEAYQWAEGILAANIPVIITETGDRSANGTKGAPFVSKVLPWADSHGVSYVAWTFNVWPQAEDNALLKSAQGAATDGFGEYYKAHLACLARSAGTCP